MRKNTKYLAVASVAVMMLTACGGDDPEDGETADPTSDETSETTEPSETETTAAPTNTETEAAPPARADADLVIWADDTRAPVIEPFAEQFAKAQGITVAVQEVPVENLRDFVVASAPAGEGPDVFVGAHDWLGELAANGVVAALHVPNVDAYSEVALQAFNYEGTIYGLPYATENIALVRNTELAPEAPASLMDMAETGVAAVEAGDADVAIGWQQPDVYHDYWVVTGAGGYVFGQTEDGAYDPADLGIDSEGGLEAAAIFGQLAEMGAISQDVTYDVMLESFAGGRTPYAITGPWAIADFEAGDVTFVVEPMPSVDGGTAAPFVGVQGFYVSAFSANELAAKTFVLDFMGTEEAQLELYEAGHRPPALISAFEQISDDPVVQGFGAAGENGQPLPAIPAMGSVWDAWGNAYTLILQGEDPEAAFQDAAGQIRTLIEG